MKIDCLDCLLAVQARLKEKKKAQDLVLANNGEGLQEAQYFEGEIMALEFVQKIMTKALNREARR